MRTEITRETDMLAAFIYSFLLPDNSQVFVAEANIQIFRHQELGNRTVLNKSVATLLIYQAAY